MKLLVTGANGFLGAHLCRFFKDRCEVTATGRGPRRVAVEGTGYFDLDITVSDEVRAMMDQARPDVVIHAAAMSRPDECDVNRDRCAIVNAMATKTVLAATKMLDNDAHFIYISSDFVLGDDGPHSEDALTKPLNYYGMTKLAGERVMEDCGMKYSIVRPVFLYGEIWDGMRPTFLHWVKDNLEAGNKIKVVTDQRRMPTYARDACKGIASIIERGKTGIFHLAGEETLSPYAMAVQVAGMFSLDATLIEPVTADTFKEPVRRPRTGGLLIDKAKRELDYRPISFAEGLRLSFPR
jgi:dTDP-4-dehydrorhamnose reductase